MCRGELKGLGPDAVHKHGDAVAVEAAGRCVEVLEEFAERVAALGEDDDRSEFLPSGEYVNRTPQWVKDRAGLPELSGDRLRAYFICQLLKSDASLERVKAQTGVKQLGSLDDYVSFAGLTAQKCEERRASGS